MLTSIPYNTIAAELTTALNSAQSSLTNLLNTYQSGDNASIPFLGSSLGNAAQFFPQLLNGLSVLGSTAASTSVQDAFVHAFGSQLANDNDAPGAAADVHATTPASDGSFQAYMRLHVGINPVMMDFKSGLPAVPLQLAGAALDFAVNSSVDYELSFSFTAGGSAPHTTLSGGHSLTGSLPGVGHELVLISSAQLPTSFSGTATLGFVQGTIGLAQNKTSSLSVTATADQFETTPVRGPLTFAADAYLQLTGGIAGVPAASAFPTISTTIHLQWDNSAGGGPHISFEGVTVNLGQFIRNVLGPVLSSIQSATAKIKPAIDALTQSLPVLSDISHVIGGGDVSLMSITSIAGSYAGLGPLAGLFSNIVTFIQAFDGFDPSLGSIDLGSFNLDGFNVQSSPTAGNPLDLANKYLTSFDFSNLAGQASNYSSVVDALPVSADVKANLHKLVSSLSGNPNSIDLEFPILNSPGKTIFNMLMGRDSDLFTLKGNLAVDATESTGADLFGMGLSFNGAVHLAGQLTFAYDTYGLRELTRDGAGNIANDLLDGFYIKTDSNLQIGGSIGISAGISAGIASASVNGTVGTPNGQSINITIDASKDTDHDGKLRFHEFPSNPLDAFNASGEIDAALTFEIQIGVKVPFVGFVGYEKDFDIARTVIVSFSPPSPPPDATLASPAEGAGAPLPGNGVVQLFTGQQASRRSGVDNNDGGPDGSGETYVIKHVGDDTDPNYGGETIEIDAFGKKQIIHNVKTILGNGDFGDLRVTVEAGVEANVFLNNSGEYDQNGQPQQGYVNRGHAYLTYRGTGQSHLTAGRLDSSLSGGAGPNFLTGGAGNDTFTTGAGGNSIVDNAGNNLIIDQDPAGSINLTSTSSAFNTLKLVAAKTTTSISATADSSDLRIQTQESNGNSTFSEISHISQLIVDAQASALAIDIGSLRALDIEEVTVYENAASTAGRSISIDTPTPTSGNPVFLTMAAANDPNVSGAAAHGISVTDNSIGGTSVAVLGLTGADTLTIKQHGGATSISDLGLIGRTIILDNSNEQSGFSVATTMTTPVQSLGSTIATDGYGVFGSGGFRVQAPGDPDIVLKGMAATDSMTVNVSAASLNHSNQVNVDASVLTGILNITSVGSSLALDNVVVSAVSEHATVNIDGAHSNTTVTIGAGSLGPILGYASVTRAAVTVDNSTNTSGSILTLAGATLAGWNTPFFSPALTLTGALSLLIKAAAGDRYDVESTPVSISQIDIQKASGARALVCVVAALSNMVFDGDFQVFLGARLASDGTVRELHNLAGLANRVVTLNFSSIDSSPTLVKLIDSGSQTYNVGGTGNLVITDQTVGLVVTINGYRSQDGLIVEMPGGSVDANLTQTGPGTLSLDGSARLSGTSVSAPLNVTIHARPGKILLRPTGANSSTLPLFNTVNLLGAMPQDSLDVYDSTNHIAIANDAASAPYARFASVSGDPTIVSVGQSFDFTIVARDAQGATLADYAGPVQWYAYNLATGDYISSDYELFAPADQGQHVFHGLVLPATGIYSLGFDDGWNVSSFTLDVLTAPQGHSNVQSGGAGGTPHIAAAASAAQAAASASDAAGSAAAVDAPAASTIQSAATGAVSSNALDSEHADKKSSARDDRPDESSFAARRDQRAHSPGIWVLPAASRVAGAGNIHEAPAPSSNSASQPDGKPHVPSTAVLIAALDRWFERFGRKTRDRLPPPATTERHDLWISLGIDGFAKPGRRAFFERDTQDTIPSTIIR